MLIAREEVCSPMRKRKSYITNEKKKKLH